MGSPCNRPWSSTGPFFCCGSVWNQALPLMWVIEFDSFSVWTTSAPSSLSPLGYLFYARFGSQFLLLATVFPVLCFCSRARPLPLRSQFPSCVFLILPAATDSCLCLNASASFLVSARWCVCCGSFFLSHQPLCRVGGGQQHGRVKWSRKDSMWRSFSPQSCPPCYAPGTCSGQGWTEETHLPGERNLPRNSLWMTPAAPEGGQAPC